MLSISANYKDGKITFIDQMPVQIRKAKLTILVEPVDELEKSDVPAQEFIDMEKDSEIDYKLIGLNSFFDTETDKNINWEDYFGLK